MTSTVITGRRMNRAAMFIAAPMRRRRRVAGRRGPSRLGLDAGARDEAELAVGHDGLPGADPRLDDRFAAQRLARGDGAHLDRPVRLHDEQVLPLLPGLD